MITNPDEAGDIVAKHYNLTPAVARSAVRNLVASRTQGVEYWGSGQINIEGLKRMIDIQKSLGAIQGDADVTKMVDTQFLPEDIRKLK
jgi:NitT/TauT family transport system substrate-binding protein